MKELFKDIPEALKNNYNLPKGVVLDLNLPIQYYQILVQIKKVTQIKF